MHMKHALGIIQCFRLLYLFQFATRFCSVHARLLQYVHIVQCVIQPIGQFYYFVYDYMLLCIIISSHERHKG